MSNASQAAAPRAIGDTPSGERPSALEVRQDTHPEERQAIARLGMWIFLASEVLFFGGLLVAYLYGRSHWPEGYAAASRRTDVLLGTVNTAILLTSSAAAAIAVAAAEANRRALAARSLWITAALGVAFLAIKGWEWHAEWQEGLLPGAGFAMDAATPGAQLFFVLYFLMTGVHAVHMVVGIGVIMVIAWRTRRDETHSASTATRPAQQPSVGAKLRIEIAALYWHFVDVIWIFLYPLLYLVERHS